MQEDFPDQGSKESIKVASPCEQNAEEYGVSITHLKHKCQFKMYCDKLVTAHGPGKKDKLYSLSNEITHP